MLIVAIDEKVMDDIVKKLKDAGKNPKPVIKKAINKVEKDAKDRIYNQTKVSYTIKGTALKKSDLKIKNATVGSLEAVIRTSGAQVPVTDGYQYRRNQNGQAAKVRIRKDKQLEELILPGGSRTGSDLKAFVAKMSNGHKGIVRRATPAEQDQSSKSKNPSRLIKQIHSLSRPQAAGNQEKVWEVVLPDLRDGLVVQLHKFMNEALA